MGEEKLIIIQLKTGEIIVTYTDDVDPWYDTNIAVLKVSYPAMIVPLQNQPGQIGFQKYFPFSEQQGAEIRKSQISTVSKPLDSFEKAYENWLTNVKAQDAGIVLAK